MFQFPPIPSWDAMHPLIIHFPIALLLLCPLFVIISVTLPYQKSRPYLLVALIVLLLGTGSLFLAASSGEEAAELADRSGGVSAVLSVHEDLADKAKAVFSALSLLLVGLAFWPILRPQHVTRLSSKILPIAFLAIYSIGVVLLVNTAHAGGRLVHEFGVHAMVPQEGATTEHPAAERASATQSDTD